MRRAHPRFTAPIALAGVVVLVLLGCQRSPEAPRFSESRARAHVARLAGEIGRRPTGTGANVRARDYLVGALRAAGFDVRVQEAEARLSGTGRTARLANIIATPPGTDDATIALAAHYDSTPDGPGAADDAFGAAVCVEAGRAVLAAGARGRAPIVILTDGEELGLMGAAAILDDPVAGRIRAVLNFEAIGSGGPVMLFEAGPGAGPLLDAWRRAAPRPRGASFMREIYKAISRGGDRTDLGLLRRAGIPGLDVALIGDGYTYHTPLDDPARLDAHALARAGNQAVAMLHAIDLDALAAAARGSGTGTMTPQAEATTYFDIIGLAAVVYGSRGEQLVAGLAALLGVLAWGRLVVLARRRVGLLRVLVSVPWAVGGTVLVALAMAGAAWLLRAARASLHPWYAHPTPFYVWLLSVAVLVGWSLVQAGGRLPRRLRGSADPLVVWILALPAWLALAGTAARVAPASAFLAAWPVIVSAAALLALPIDRPGGLRGASLAAAAAIAALWLPNVASLLRFVVPELDRTPLVTPIFFYPALLLGAGLMLAPPVLALLGGLLTRRGTVAMVLAIVAMLAFAAAWSVPAYTHERPLHHVIRYVADVGAGRAAWEAGANEPAPPAPGWRPGPAPVPSPLPRIASPFVYNAPASIPGQLPLRVTGSLTLDADARLEIHAVPVAPAWTVAFALPEGAVPLETNLPASPWIGRQVAVFVAVPPEGVTFRARYRLADAGSLSSAAVIAMGHGLPGSRWPRLPDWLPQQRDVWQARQYYVMPVEWAGPGRARWPAPTAPGGLIPGARERGR